MFDGLLDSTRPRCERVKTGSNRRKSKSWVRDGGINSANDNLFANQTFTIDKLEPPRACVWIGSREIEVFGYRGHGLWWETTRSDTGQISGFAGCRCVLKPRLIQLRSPEWTIPMIRWPCIHLEDRIAPKPALENWHRALCQWTRLFPRRMFFFFWEGEGGGGAFPTTCTHASDFIHGSFFRRSPSLTILLAFLR